MTYALKQQLILLVGQNIHERQFPDFVCIGKGSIENPLALSFGIPREHLYLYHSLDERLVDNCAGDDKSAVYYLKKDYYQKFLSIPTTSEPGIGLSSIDWGEQKLPEKDPIIAQKEQENRKIMEKEEQMVELQRDFILRNNLSVGSKVKVLKKFKDYSSHPRVNWVIDMDNTIGEVGTISLIDEKKPLIQVHFEDTRKTWCYAYDCLQAYYEPHEALYLENNNTALINNDGSLLLSGFSITFDELEQLYFMAGIRKNQKQKSSGKIDDGSHETWKDSNNPFNNGFGF